MEEWSDRRLVLMLQNPRSLAPHYAGNKPFPHIVLKNIWDDEQLGQVADECEKFEDWDEEKKFFGSIGKRTCGTLSKFPPAVLSLVNYCNCAKFLRSLELLTGEIGLIPDPYLYGGGIHSTLNNGFLKMHADFNWHHHLKLYRRLNLLIYLNRDWDEGWGGGLRLASLGESGLETGQIVMPNFNKTVIFTTTDSSFHGHPDPMNLPVGRVRNSIALYYYVSTKPEDTSEFKRLETDYRLLDGSELRD